ncbi:MAG: DUF3427 domain-containing protein [Bradyrhizobiaceae bacterium]|nr:DUF3427 domain-containing protein [Bradyrhizobiaceae bacterium]
MYDFDVGYNYSRKDVIRIVGLPVDTAQGGDWTTGYASHGDDHFLFCNVGTPGRTGHDYGNRFEGDRLVWYAKNGRKLSSSSVQRLVHPQGHIHIFIREDTRTPFTFAGYGICEEARDTMPVEVTWSLHGPGSVEISTSHINGEARLVTEGLKTTVVVNRYERSRWARKRCIQRWGTACSVCAFDFVRTYGNLGTDFIHVHHLVEVASIGKEYHLHPENDLRPVCPNCHAMLHRREPAITIEELKAILDGHS